MPGFDGTGPLGQGPFTGGGKGFCVMPIDYSSRSFSGFVGLQNFPVNIPYSNPQTHNSFLNLSYRYLPYQLRSIGYLGRLAGYFRGRGGKGMRGIRRKF
ncbi:MAG: DUF5320 domain-containing protein [Actinomycetia bacterium]|nr:DUF5320 domain-containing protein [Actinomycetes bacterium]